MWQKRVFVLSLLLSFVLCFPLLSEEVSKGNVVINANTTTYLDEGAVIHAQGSVEVIYNSTTIEGEDFFYYVNKNIVSSESDFSLKYSGVEIKGNKLAFNIKTGIGSASETKVLYKNVQISGKKVFVVPGKVEIKEADFTTCNLDHPHYDLKSQSIDLLYEEGWVMCYWSIFWIGDVPTVPFPIYVYDIKVAERGGAQSLPYPTVGSDQNYGYYLVQSIPWYASINLHGDYMLGYSEYKGLGLGGDVAYKINDENSGNASIFGYRKDRISTKIEHYYYFGGHVPQSQQFNFNLFKLPKIKQFLFKTKLSLNEQLNNEKVSMVPMLSLVLNKATINNISFDGDFSSGYVTEESTGSYGGMLLGSIGFSVPVLETALGTLSPNLRNQNHFYSNYSPWIKVLGGVSIDKQWTEHFSTELGYRHFFMNQGTSQYKYETYQFTPKDQISAGFITNGGISKFGINVLYNLPELSPQEFDYLARIGVHCFNLTLNYRAIRKEFTFSFGIN